MKWSWRWSKPAQNSECQQEPGISDEHRNGSITAIGIVLGFSLTFMASWAQGDGPWERSGMLILFVLGLGICLQIISLWKLLVLPNTHGLQHGRTAHNRAVGLFGVGMSIVFAGFLIWVGIGMARDLRRSATADSQREPTVCQLLSAACSTP